MNRRFLSIFSMTILTAGFCLIVNAQDVKQDQTVGAPPDKRAETPFEKGFGKNDRFRRGRLQRRKMAGMKLMKGLYLSDEQKQQIRAILEANRPSPENKERIRSLLVAKRNGSITPEQEAELRQIREAAGQRFETVQSQIQAVLTDEQKAEIERRKQEVRERIQTRHEYQRSKRQDRPISNN